MPKSYKGDDGDNDDEEEEDAVAAAVGPVAKTAAIFASFFCLGLARTMQGPSLLDLKAQVEAEIADFKLVFLLGTVSFPLGNYIGKRTLSSTRLYGPVM